ncbi:hypothetical protein D3C76_1568030 [compost metagenome]
MAGSPFFICSPVPSSVADPELIRCKMPFAAAPSSLCPVTRSTEFGLQYVRTSAKICAVFVSKYPNSMPTPFKLSFSVATTKGARIPFQSKEEFSIVSIKSPFGEWSVHCRCPWNPEAMA